MANHVALKWTVNRRRAVMVDLLPVYEAPRQNLFSRPCVLKDSFCMQKSIVAVDRTPFGKGVAGRSPNLFNPRCCREQLGSISDRLGGHYCWRTVTCVVVSLRREVSRALFFKSLLRTT